MVIFKLIRAYIKAKIRGLKDGSIRLLPIYYRSFHQISLRKWFELKDGNYRSLYKYAKFKYIPAFFYEIVLNMLYELDHVDMTMFRKKADLAILESIAARTGSKTVKFQADVLANEIRQKESKETETIKLNEFIDYIELTFNQIGMVDPDRMKASRALSLYNKAVEQNKRLQKQAEKVRK